jgi:putative nucleotidyltransferase with HDIG domain
MLRLIVTKQCSRPEAGGEHAKAAYAWNYSSHRGTNGNPIYTPFEGYVQAIRQPRSTILGAPTGDASTVDPLFRRSIAYATSLGIVTAALVLGLIGTGYTLGPIWPLFALAATAVLAERGRVQLERGVQMESSISNLPLLFTAVVLGPLAAMIVGAASMIGAVRRPFLRPVTYSFIRALCGGLTGLAAALGAGFTEAGVGSVALAIALGALTVEAADLALLCLTVKLRAKPVRPLAGVVFRINALSVPLYAPLVGLLALAYLRVSPWTLPLFLLPALAAQRLFGLYQGERGLAQDLTLANERLERANLSFATALVATLDARDRYTAGHSAAVAIYARDIAERLGLSQEEQELAHLCGLVHDIGKIGLPAGLLEKPGALTLDERKQMQEHSAIGEGILVNWDIYPEIAKIVRHHHERMDGMGYPDGISADQIPLISRIISVADAYNAMTSDRPYRDAMPSRVARMRLAQGVEGQFDTTVVAAFEAILAGAAEDYRTATRLDFTLEAQDNLVPTADDYPKITPVAECPPPGAPLRYASGH